MRVQKLINDQWIPTHVRFLRKGDVVRVKGNKEWNKAEVTSDVYWDKVQQQWNIDLVEKGGSKK